MHLPSAHWPPFFFYSQKIDCIGKKWTRSCCSTIFSQIVLNRTQGAVNRSGGAFHNKVNFILQQLHGATRTTDQAWGVHSHTREQPPFDVQEPWILDCQSLYS